MDCRTPFIVEKAGYKKEAVLWNDLAAVQPLCYIVTRESLTMNCRTPFIVSTVYKKEAVLWNDLAAVQPLCYVVTREWPHNGL